MEEDEKFVLMHVVPEAVISRPAGNVLCAAVAKSLHLKKVRMTHGTGVLYHKQMMSKAGSSGAAQERGYWENF